MNISVLREICLKAYCQVCFERFESLNEVPNESDQENSFILNDKLFNSLNSKNLFDKGRKMIFCMSCKSTVHSGCYRPETSFPVEIKLHSNKVLNLEYFECNRCMSKSDIKFECSLCGINKGFIVPLKIVSPDDYFLGSSDAFVKKEERNGNNEVELCGMEIETPDKKPPFNFKKEAMCHVLCGLLNNGVYYSQNYIELNPSFMKQYIDRKCHVCDRKLMNGFTKCTDCNLHQHLFCFLLDNVEKAFEEGIQSSRMVQVIKEPRDCQKSNQTAIHSSDNHLQILINQTFEQFLGLKLFPQKEISDLFMNSVQQKIGNYNSSLEFNCSIRFRCRHHQVSNEISHPLISGKSIQKCENCFGISTSVDAREKSNSICQKCKILKQLSSLESKSDFDTAKESVNQLAQLRFSLYDHFFLGRLFYNRLVFIVTMESLGNLLINGFKIIKAKLIEQLYEEFVEHVFKSVKRKILNLIFEDSEFCFPKSIEFLSNSIVSVRSLSNSSETNMKFVSDLIEKLENFANRLKCVEEGNTTFRKILKKIEKICQMKEAKNTKFYCLVENASEFIPEFESEFSDYLFFLSTQKQQIFDYLKIKFIIIQLIKKYQTRINENIVIQRLLIAILVQFDFVSSFTDCIDKLYQNDSINPSETVCNLIYHGKISNLELNLEDFLDFARIKNKEAIQESFFDQIFNTENLKMISDFKKSAARHLASLHYSEAKTVAILPILIQDNLFSTCQHVKDFLFRNSCFGELGTYKRVEKLYEKSIRVNQIYKKRLTMLIQTFLVEKQSIDIQISILNSFMKDYFNVCFKQNSFIDPEFLEFENKVYKFNYVLEFVLGQQVKKKRLLETIMDLQTRENQIELENKNEKNAQLNTDVPIFYVWERILISQYNHEIIAKAVDKISTTFAAFEGFKQKIMITLFSNTEDKPSISIGQIYDEIEKLKNFPFTNFDHEIKYFNQLITIIEACKRTIQVNYDISSWQLLDLISHTKALEKFSELIKKHNRTERLLTIVGFLTKFGTLRTEVENFVKPVLRIVLNRKFEILSEAKYYSVEKIIEFNRLLSFSNDRLIRDRITDNRIFDAYNDLISSLKAIFTDPEKVLIMRLLLNDKSIQKLKNVISFFFQNEKTASEANEFLPQEYSKPNLDQVSGFLKTLTHLLQKLDRFEKIKSISTIIEFLEKCQKLTLSINVLLIVTENNLEKWNKISDKYKASFENLNTYINDLAEMYELRPNEEIYDLLEKSKVFLKIYSRANTLTTQFRQRQKSRSNENEEDYSKLVSIDALKELKDTMKPMKSMIPEKYEEVKKTIKFIESFEENLAIEVETLSDLILEITQLGKTTEWIEDTPWQLLNDKDHSLLFLGFPVEAPKNPTFKAIKAKYYDTRKLYHNKSFNSATITFNMKHYRVLYNLYKLYSQPKTSEDLHTFLETTDFSTIEEDSGEHNLIGYLSEVSMILDNAMSNQIFYVDEQLVERIYKLKSIFYCTCVDVKEDQDVGKKIAGLYALRFLCYEKLNPIFNPKSFQLKTAIYAVLQSGLKIAEPLSQCILASVSAETRLIKYLETHRLGEKYLAKFVIEYYLQNLEYKSEELEEVTSTYLTQVEKVLSIRNRVFETPCIPDQSLSLELILQAFGSNQVTSNKEQKLKIFCNRAATSKFALICQLNGNGHLNAFNLALQTILDSNDFQSDYEALFRKLDSQKHKVVDLSTATLLYDRSIRKKPTDRGVFGLFVDFRTIDQVDALITLSTQIALILHIYNCLEEESIVVKIKELKVYFNEIKIALNNVAKLGINKALADRIDAILKPCWKKADNIIQETEEYVASLSSITIIAETVFTYRNIVSTSDMIEGIHEINSKLVEAMNPFRGSLNNPNNEDLSSINEQFIAIENDLISINDTYFEEFKDLATETLETIEIDVSLNVIDVIGRYQRDLRNQLEQQPTPADRPLPNEAVSKPKNREKTHSSASNEYFENLDAKQNRSKNKTNFPNPQSTDQPIIDNTIQVENDNYFEISENDDNPQDSGPTNLSNLNRPFNLEFILGQRSFWKRFQRAIKGNPRYKDAQNKLNLLGFCKRLEKNFKSLQFLYTNIDSEQIEGFLSNYKDIDRLIEKYNSQKLNYQNVIDLVQDPTIRLKRSSKTQSGKANKKNKSSMLNEIYADLDHDQEEVVIPKIKKPEPSKETPAPLMETNPEIGKHDSDVKQDEQSFLKSIEIKRIKPSVLKTMPVTSLLKFSSEMIAKIQFIDDKTIENDKVNINDVSFYTNESASILKSFPCFAKPFKFRSSQLKKSIEEIQRDFFLRQTTGNNIVIGHCFLPINKIQTAFYTEIEKGMVCGYACSPTLHIFIAHISKIRPEVFSTLDIYFPDDSLNCFANLFVFFLKKVEADLGNQSSMKVETIFESDDSNFLEVQNRKVFILKLQKSYFDAYAQAKALNIQPQIYYKMNNEILNLRSEQVLSNFGLEHTDKSSGLPIRSGSQIGVQPPLDGVSYQRAVHSKHPMVGFPPGMSHNYLMNDPRFLQTNYTRNLQLPANFQREQTLANPMHRQQFQADQKFINYIPYYHGMTHYGGNEKIQTDVGKPSVPSRGFIPQTGMQYLVGRESAPIDQTGLFEGPAEHAHELTLSEVPQKNQRADLAINQKPNKIFSFESASLNEQEDLSLLPNKSEVTLIPNSNSLILTEEDEQIKEMIMDQSLTDLLEIYQEADQGLRDSIMKVLKIVRPIEANEFSKMINN